MKTQFMRALLAIAVLAAASAQAEEFPARPIKWIVPYLAGTAPDITVRVVADAMSGILKQAVVVENKGGVAGNLGAQLAAKSAPDGYTWVYSANPMATSMYMYKKPGFDVLKDFTHVGRVAYSDSLLVVNADSGIGSLKDLIERGRKDPGKLAYASGGIGSPAHMGTEMFLNYTGVQALHVPYKGASESSNAVLGKLVDFAVTIFSVSQPYVQGGKLTALAVTGPYRNSRLPNVPTLIESGVPVTLVSYGGLSVPAGTPPKIVKQVADALNKALAMPEVRKKLESQGGTVAPSTPEEFAENFRAEVARTERMMKAAKLEPQ